MVSKENGVGRDDQLSEMEKNVKQSRGESDYDLTRDSLSSQGETASNEDSRSKRSSRVPKKLVKNEPANNSGRGSRAKNNNQGNTKLQFKSSVNDQKRVKKTGDKIVTPKSVISKTPGNTNVPSGPYSEGSEEMDDKPTEEVKEIDVLDEVHNCDQSIGTDDEMVDTEENGVDDDKARTHRKIDELESRIEKLEEELREVAALEISLYSVAPEHGSSAHKIHTPARRLSRLYVHACKYWTPERKATVARNTVSGLVLVSKSCGSDVPRLTFWLSNTIFLRKIIHQTFGNLSQSNGARRTTKANGSAKKADEIFVSPKRKSYSGFKQAKNVSLMQLENDWHDIHTFTTALEEVESWMFSRIVESIWWQTLTPYMQSPAEEMSTPRGLQKLLGPALGDRQQGSFSINLWKNAFQDAFARLCPIRSGGHECGCLPVLARMVMEQCVSRLDVAMFNAILRESAYELPTDPLSDPIVDPRVLPIPAGDLSFGSGAQLKNAIGNWSRWLTDLFGMDTEDSQKDDSDVTEDYDMREGNHCIEPFFPLSGVAMKDKRTFLRWLARPNTTFSVFNLAQTRIEPETSQIGIKLPTSTSSPDWHMREGNAESKSFCLLNELSDLLMLPKDMLLEASIRKEVCPSICLPLVIRVLCNFSLDEFCPEPVPGYVLEELNTECILQRKLSVSDPVSSFPYVAQPVVYSLPLQTDVALNVGIFPQKSELDRRASVVQKKGYTSDDDLDDLDSPLTSIMDQICPVSPVPINGSKQERWQPNLRYKLLGEVWSA